MTLSLTLIAAAHNAHIRFIRRIQIERAHDPRQVASHSQIVAAAVQRDAELGVNLLREHIEMSVSAAQKALKDALLKIYTSTDSILPLQEPSTHKI